MSATTTTPMLHVSNILGSPGSTWTGAGVIFGVLATAMSGAMPTTSQGWVAFAVAVLLGIGGIFSKA